MIAFYGMGGGLGHLTRIKTFIQNQSIKEDFRVITANPKAKLFFEPEQLILINATETTKANQLHYLIQKETEGYFFDELYIDAFPCGILGELSSTSIPFGKCHYLVRHLNWAAYQHLINNAFRFETAFVFESLTLEHQQFISMHSNRIIDIQLEYEPPEPMPEKYQSLTQKSIWLIVHSTHVEEVETLINHAKDIAMMQGKQPQFVVITDLKLNSHHDVLQLKDEHPINWFPIAEKIFSAAGFNTWYQLAPYREKQICIPFPRKFDDQFWRCGG